MVCLSSDEQIKRLKGGDRPINTLKDRLNMLLHFDFVDNVILYEETDDDKQAELDVIINIIKPYFWFKGPDYNVAEIKKLHPILDNIMVIKSPFSSSTTKIIKRIKGY
jgi:D-beta-D-heptose 7-phosphate kinase/D-beta-D-heptose 1-phosphate adenosyltransferase